MDILVLGAGGHIGTAVTQELLTGHSVTALTHQQYDVNRPRWPIGEITQPASLDAVICCVGHCPAGGFANAVARPLSQYNDFELMSGINMHIIGPFNVFQQVLTLLRSGACFVFMSSAATRLLQMPRDKRPPALNIYPHLAVMAAEDALIEGMRMDPAVIDRDIKIHKIMPPAIGDSPFHRGGPKLPTTVTTEEVVRAICSCLPARNHQDVNMVP